MISVCQSDSFRDALAGPSSQNAVPADDRPATAGGVVDVDRVDADELHTGLDEERGGSVR